MGFDIRAGRSIDIYVGVDVGVHGLLDQGGVEMAGVEGDEVDGPILGGVGGEAVSGWVLAGGHSVRG